MRISLLVILATSVVMKAADKLPDGAVARVGSNHRRTALIVSPDGKTLAVRLPDGFDLIDLATGKTVQLRDNSGKRFLSEKEVRDSGDTSLAFFPDGKAVARANQQECVSVWDTATGKHLRDVPTPNQGEFDNKGQPTDTRHKAGVLFCSSFLNGLVVAEERRSRKLFVLGAKDVWSVVALYAPGSHEHATSNGRWITGVEEQASIEFNFYSVELFTENKGVDRSEVFQGQLLDQTRYASRAATSDDGKLVAVWSTETGKAEKSLFGLGLVSRSHNGKPIDLIDGDKGFNEVDAIGFSSDSKRLFCATPEVIAQWDTVTGKRGKDISMPVRNPVVVFDPPRDRAILSGDGYLYVLDLKK
jgi:WD40 repeat protein